MKQDWRCGIQLLWPNTEQFSEVENTKKHTDHRATGKTFGGLMKLFLYL